MARRRIAKIVYNWNTGTSAWNATATEPWDPNAGGGAWDPNNPTALTKLIYDGWRPIMELDGLNQGGAGVPPAIRKYTWGLDLSGLLGPVSDRSGLDGAGGIGGLLAISDPDDPNDPNDPHGDFVVFQDANGNVDQLFDLSAADPNDPNTASDAIVAHYEYDPYGNAVTTTGDYAAENPLRFSTKYWDDETGLGYWGRRYYDPRLGRWLTRDPLEELDASNLYLFVHNTPASESDLLGLMGDWLCSSYIAGASFCRPWS